MTDLLATLADRAIAPARARPDVSPRLVAMDPGARPVPVIRPRTASLDDSLEQQAWTDAPELSDDAPEARRDASTPSRRAGARSRRPDVLDDRPSTDAAPRAATAEPAAATDRTSAGRRPADAQARAADRLSTPVPETPASRPTRAEAARLESEPRAPLADAAPAPAMPVRRPTDTGRPDVAIVPAVAAAIEVATHRAPVVDPRAAVRADEGGPETPRTVHVSIGRVEVHAPAVPAPVPARPVPQLAAPRTSLDDYLRGRDESRR